MADALWLWTPVIAAIAGAAIGAAASLGTGMITTWMHGKRERDAKRNAEIDAAQLALKGIGQEMVEQIVAPGWWPRVRMLRPTRDFAYDVVRTVPDEKATAEWTAAAQEILIANTTLWRVWLWHLFKIGIADRQRMVERVMAAEAAMVAAAEDMRPGRKKSRRDRIIG